MRPLCRTQTYRRESRGCMDKQHNANERTQRNTYDVQQTHFRKWVSIVCEVFASTENWPEWRNIQPTRNTMHYCWTGCHAAMTMQCKTNANKRAHVWQTFRIRCDSALTTGFCTRPTSLNKMDNNASARCLARCSELHASDYYYLL